MTAFTITAFTLLSGIVRSQGSDSVIIRAMHDEMKRNMTELKYEGFERPFYVAYSIEDRQQYTMIAVLGSLLRSSYERQRGKNVRVLVGDYEFNDESLDNNSFSPPEPNEIELPLDDDYFGIRRSLWVTTDYVYKSAARQYKQNLEVLEQKKKTIAEMPHRTFAKKPSGRIINKAAPYTVDVPKLENYVRVLSQEFANYPAIEHSSVYVAFDDGHKYFVNSEGMVAITPDRWASVHLYAMTKTAEGEAIQEQVIHNAFTPDQLPSIEKMKEEVKRLCTYVTSAPIPRFEDEYNGPVLIVGKAVAHLFARTLFQSKDALIASNMLPDPRGYRSSADQTSIETRIGKSIVPAGITVRSLPHLSSFEGTPLAGSYAIDDEGVVPENETILIEKGILRTLLNDRSKIKEFENANGHSSGPGVIDVFIDNGSDMSVLKRALIEEARKDGQEYAIILVESPDIAGGVHAIRISVADGKEQTFRAPQAGNIELKDLRELKGASSQRRAYNIPFGSDKPASFIVPEAILLKEFEVSNENTTYFKDEQYISSPLNK